MNKDLHIYESHFVVFLGSGREWTVDFIKMKFVAIIHSLTREEYHVIKVHFKLELFDIQNFLLQKYRYFSMYQYIFWY